jgi:hypothetical protein
MELARGREYGVFDRSIDVQISRLRKIVEDDHARPRHIQTVWASATYSCLTATRSPPERPAGAFSRRSAIIRR